MTEPIRTENLAPDELGADDLIVSAKMNDVDPQVWLADVLARIAIHPRPQAR